MARKVTIDGLADAIKRELEEYGEDVTTSMKETTRIVARQGAAALRSEANATFKPSKKLQKGRYGSGWTSTVEDRRLYSVGTIYNSKYPGLPHLLENGHAKRGGGRVEGREHIKPVEERVIEQFQKALVEKIT